MGLKYVSASRGVIGDLSRPVTNNYVLLEVIWNQDERKGEESRRWASFRFYRAGKKDGSVIKKEKKCIFRPEKCG